MKELMNKVEEKFLEALEEKNSWGKNEIRELYTRICKDVYLEYLSVLAERQ